MNQKLPYGNFNWVEDAEKLTEDDIIKIDAEGENGYFLEVDLEYPESLHDLHNNYPLAPEKIVVDNDMLSPFSLGMKEKLNISDDKTSKLICTLNDKNNYGLLHIKNLKLYLSLGLKIKKVQKINFELVHDENRLVKLASKAQYKDHILYGDENENLCGVSMAKTNIVLDKPIYVGMSILDLSKTLI